MYKRQILFALLDPSAGLKKAERKGNNGSRLGLMEEMKTLPFGAVWDWLCLSNEVPVGKDWIDEVERYEGDVLSQRG